MVNVFKVDRQKKMVGGRKCAIRSFGVISTVWFELDCKHSGWEDMLPPGWGSCQPCWAQDQESQGGTRGEAVDSDLEALGAVGSGHSQGRLLPAECAGFTERKY